MFIKNLIIFSFTILSCVAMAETFDYSKIPGHWVGKEKFNEAGFSYGTYDVVIKNNFETTYKTKEHCNLSEAPKDKIAQDFCINMNSRPEMSVNFDSETIKQLLKIEYKLQDSNTLVMRNPQTGQDRILTKQQY